MKNNKELIYGIMQDALGVSKEMVQHIKRTPGGETNDSYFVTIEEERFVVRIPGKGTEELLDRCAEKQNLLFGTELGINPPLVYYDDETGVKITRAIDGAEALTPKMAREKGLMQDVIHLFQCLHHAEAPTMNRFDLFKRIAHYETLVKNENEMKLDQIASLRQDIHKLKNVYQSFQVKEVPCHMDAVFVNILKDKEDHLFLIDWEYSGLCDPLWDIATLSLSLLLDEEEEMFFLSYYFGRSPNEEELQRLHLLKIFLDYYWSLWYFYKEAKGEQFGDSGMRRVNRAESHITQYKDMYESNIVV